MNVEIVSILAPQTGYCHNLIRRTMDAGRETKEARDIRVQKALEEARKKVPRVYDSRAKIIEYDNYGRHFDIKV